MCESQGEKIFELHYALGDTEYKRPKFRTGNIFHPSPQEVHSVNVHLTSKARLLRYMEGGVWGQL